MLDVRVRILRPSAGIYDGVSLSHFIPGVVYDVPGSLGLWLISRAIAQEDLSDADAILASGERRDVPPSFTGGVVVFNDRAHDTPPRKKNKRR